MKDPDLFSGLLLFILLSVAGGLALSATRNHRQALGFQVRIFLYAFAVRFALSIVIYEFGLVNILGDEDASGWLAGVGFQQTWMRQKVDLLDLPSVLLGAYDGHHRGYGYMLGALFYLWGAPARMPAAVLNCFFGALTCVFAYRTASTLFSSWVAIRVGWLTCLFPSLVIWSAQTVKEPIVILLETIALYCCTHLKLFGFSLRHALLCGLTILLVVPFRFYAAYVAGAAVLLALILPQISRGKVTFSSALAVSVLVIPILVTSGILVRHEVEFERFNLQYIESFRRNVAVGTGSGVETSYDLQTPTGFGMATVVGGAHLLLAPFPWQLTSGSLRKMLATPELFVWWWLFFFGVLPGLWHSLRSRFSDIQPLLFFSFGLGLLYSVMFGNVGLAYRQRAQLLPWLLIFAVVGLEQRVLRRAVGRRVRISNQMATEARRWL